MGGELPHDAVEGCNAEEVPFWGNPTPELRLKSAIAS